MGFFDGDDDAVLFSNDDTSYSIWPDIVKICGIEAVRTCVNRGAKLDARNDDGIMAIQIARKHGKEDIVQFLSESGSPDAYLATPTTWGQEFVDSLPENATVLFEEGDYVANVQLNRSVTLKPVAALLPSVNLKASDTACPVLSLVKGFKGELEKLSFIGSHPEQILISIQDSGGVLDSLSFDGNYRTAIAVNGTEADPVVRNCIFHGEPSAEACVRISEGARGKFISNQLNRLNSVFFLVEHDETKPVVTGNTIYKLGNDGVVQRDGPVIVVHEGASGVFSGNILNNIKGLSVHIQGKGTNPTFENNQISSAAGPGIRIDTGAKGSFIKNSIDGKKSKDPDNDATLFLVDGEGTTPVVKENTVRNSSGSGITIREGAGGLFEGNHIDGHAYAGLRLISNGKPDLTGNIITNSLNYLILENENGGTISGLHLSGKNELKNTGILLLRGNWTIENCRFDGGLGNAIVVRGSGANPIIRNCHFQGTVRGAFVSEQAQPTFENCKFIDNNDAGIIVQNGSTPNISENEFTGNPKLAAIFVETQGTSPTVRGNNFAGEGIGVKIVNMAAGEYIANTINMNAGVAFRVEAQGTHPTVRENTFKGGEKGIFGNKAGFLEIVEWASGEYIQNNIDNAGTAISIRGAGENTIIRNNSISNTYDGVNCQWGVPHIDNNRFMNCVRAIIYFYAFGGKKYDKVNTGTRITGNQIQFGSNSTGDKDETWGIIIAGSAIGSFSNNSITGVDGKHGIGISVANFAAGTFTDNTITGCKIGVSIEKDADAAIFEGTILKDNKKDWDKPLLGMKAIIRK